MKIWRQRKVRVIPPEDCCSAGETASVLRRSVLSAHLSFSKCLDEEDWLILSFCPYMIFRATSNFSNQKRRELLHFYGPYTKVRLSESWSQISFLNLSILSCAVSSELILFRNWITEDFQGKPKMTTSLLRPWLLCCYKICKMFLLVSEIVM